ncbi:endo alpha-1,4 polygalactosaminidase [Couchioplanes azureus]|uniref:endo alpha-1,4 polygalactosaminidase n=1 Tax=Couchioplanes caeruleus TaxID=56438 RepID=UPI0019CA97EB|nr:endo alpha-1,4 polygalactosaminidase [Couchioplanes caeruleus]GGQ77229.1 hypothetical protein GCM10010166_53970 [Couchioplanes caeruleus subsp. azureus]
MSAREQSRSRWRPRGVVVGTTMLVLAVGTGVAVADDHGPDRARPGAGVARAADLQAAGPTSPAPRAPDAAVGRFAPPPANAGVDYQIGTPYPPPAGVDVVLRDHGAAPAAGKYNVCYVNGFQTQPEDADWWRTRHRDLLLTRDGQEVIDEEWGEILLDISTPAKRSALAAIVNGWIDECARKGFQAVEVDNLDTFTRSDDLLTADHATAYGKLLTDHAHGRDLAVGQKNAAELAARMRPATGFDFAIAEECAHWDECQTYVETYGDRVIVIEYTEDDFDEACRGFGRTLSIVLRDRLVTAPGSSDYVYRAC